MDKPVRDQLASFEAMGYRQFPICIAKTQYSFTTNPDAKGAPADHVIKVRDVRLSAGAGVRGRDLRGDHDHAGTAESPGRGQYRCRAGWTNRGAVLPMASR